MHQIEVERKFLLTDHSLIHARAEPIDHRKFTDTYFDTVEYSLTSKSMWLRQRDREFELKCRVGQGDNLTDRYEEITGTAIAERLFCKATSASLTDLLASHQILPFATFTTNRRSYRYDKCRIDIDSADFGDFQYHVAELEIVVASADGASEAESQILEIAQELNLVVDGPVEAKLTAFLKARRPHHFAHLVDCGAIRALTG